MTSGVSDIVPLMTNTYLHWHVQQNRKQASLNCPFSKVRSFLKMDHSRPLFLYFCLFNAIDSIWVIWSLPMTGFESRSHLLNVECMKPSEQIFGSFSDNQVSLHISRLNLCFNLLYVMNYKRYLIVTWRPNC